MQADKVDPQRAKFFERVYELLQATRESVVAVDDNGIYSTLSTFSE